MPTFSRTASFRFRRGMNRTRLVKAVLAVASKYGVGRTRRRSLHRRLFSKNLIEKAARHLFSDDDRAAMRARNLIPLRAERLRFLTAMVQFHEYQISRLDRSL